jgi:hypothetical protein
MLGSEGVRLSTQIGTNPEYQGSSSSSIMYGVSDAVDNPTEGAKGAVKGGINTGLAVLGSEMQDQQMKSAAVTRLVGVVLSLFGFDEEAEKQIQATEYIENMAITYKPPQLEMSNPAQVGGDKISTAVQIGVGGVGLVKGGISAVTKLATKVDDVADVGKVANKVDNITLSNKVEVPSFEELASFRKELGLPEAGSQLDKSTIAMMKVNGEKIYGINAHGQPVSGVNAISKTHAEIDVLNQIKQKGYDVQGKDLVLYVDRTPCTACDTNGGIKSMVKQLDLKSLTVISPNGTIVITP